MKSRLGFSISSALNPDVFIVDEALSVGDPAFTEKSIERMMDFKNEGKSIIYVSHSLSQIKKFCNKVLWIEVGRIKAFGQTEEILRYYTSFMNYWKKLDSNQKSNYKEMAYKVPVYKAIDNDSIVLYDFGIDDYVWLNEMGDIKQYFISKVVKFKNNHTKIYNNITKPNNFKISKEFIGTVYFAKKIAHYNNETFMYLSRKQSYKESIIGWVNSKDLTSYDLTFISNSRFDVLIKGIGSSYKKIWGDYNDVLHESLHIYKNEIMNVESTYLLGGIHLWYYGEVKGTKQWVYYTHAKLI